MTKRIDLTGQTFGRLTVTKHVVSSYWETTCECGNTKIVHSHALRVGRTRSCGCLRNEKARERRTQHGMHGTITYNSWMQMRRRCNDPKHANYKWYGGRGVAYDPRWDSFVVFLEDMGECPDRDHTLDRIDPNKNYSKENCRWRPLKDSVQRNSIIVQGMRLKAYAEVNGLKYHTAYARWRAGTLTK